MSYKEIHKAIIAHQGWGSDGDSLRLMKLTEEVGEVVQAYIGYTGANKRKGVTHSELDIAKELCDVIITAMVALHDWVDQPELFLEAHLLGVSERVKEVGS